MTTKVWKVENQLRIETNGVTTYGNAQLYAIGGFYEDSVKLVYYGSSSTFKTTIIKFSDFQDNAGNSYTNETAIANYLAGLIG
jgi:hypothetical protein